jgi:malate dehydrogenase (oxaloacetate-decarboxylating)
MPSTTNARNSMTHHSPGYSITVRLHYPDNPGFLGRISSTIGEANGLIGAVDVVDSRGDRITRDITINATDVAHGERVVAALRSVPDIEIVNVSDRVFLMHLGGKLEVNSRVPIKTRDDLSMAYTPGVARVCRAIFEDPDASFALTIRRNTVAVVTDGSAVLGMGNIGAKAAMPVMEGKAVLFKEFGGVDAFPICLDTQNVEQIINTVKYLAPSFGGINLEDISAPRCVEIEQRLADELDIPVFHDDQHGTAIVVLAALTNALKVVSKSAETVRVVINGAGAAGAAIANLLVVMGVTNLIVCDRGGAIHPDRPGLNPLKRDLAEHTNRERETGLLSDVIAGADVFIGVSARDVLSVDDIRRMASDAIVFALANPDPEITPEAAADHVMVMATGRSDYPNQINNVLCFPGLFRGLLDVRAGRVNSRMKIAAAKAIAEIIPTEDLHPDYIVPSVFDRRVAKSVAAAVAQAAVETGSARRGRSAGNSSDTWDRTRSSLGRLTNKRTRIAVAGFARIQSQVDRNYCEFRYGRHGAALVLDPVHSFNRIGQIGFAEHLSNVYFDRSGQRQHRCIGRAVLERILQVHRDNINHQKGDRQRQGCDDQADFRHIREAERQQRDEQIAQASDEHAVAGGERCVLDAFTAAHGVGQPLQRAFQFHELISMQLALLVDPT